MPSKPTILFVPGAWHSEFHTKPVLPYFQNLGYQVQVLLLANLGTYNGKGAKPTTQDSVNKIDKAMQAEATAGHDFILLAHSAGGLVSGIAVNQFLTSATSEIRSHLKHIIFLGAFINTSRHIISHWHHMDFEKGLSWPLTPEEVFYNDMSLEESKPFCEALQTMVLVDRPSEIDPLWHQIPRTFTVLLQDRAILAEKQKVEAQEQGFEIVEFDSGHCPFISKPDAFAGVVDGIVKEKVMGKV